MLKLLTYDSLLAEASEYILSLPETKQKELKENLSHGKALLKSKDQMKAYLHHYGQMHREKLLRAYKHIPSDFLKSSFSVIDWGCGQGLASMVLSEYVPNEDIVTDFILIEPSVLCLSQANANLTWSNPKSMVDVLRKREEEVEATDICVQERKVLHLLSNVVDMPEFSGNGIRRFVFANINLNHLIIGVSPFYPKKVEERGWMNLRNHSMASRRCILSRNILMIGIKTIVVKFGFYQTDLHRKVKSLRIVNTFILSNVFIMNVLAIHLYLTFRYINLSFNYFGNFYRIIV